MRRKRGGEGEKNEFTKLWYIIIHCRRTKGKRRLFLVYKFGRRCLLGGGEKVRTSDSGGWNEVGKREKKKFISWFQSPQVFVPAWVYERSC